MIKYTFYIFGEKRFSPLFKCHTQPMLFFHVHYHCTLHCTDQYTCRTSLSSLDTVHTSCTQLGTPSHFIVHSPCYLARMSRPLIGQQASYSPLIGRHLGLTPEWAPTTTHFTTTSSPHSISTSPSYQSQQQHGWGVKSEDSENIVISDPAMWHNVMGAGQGRGWRKY